MSDHPDLDVMVSEFEERRAARKTKVVHYVCAKCDFDAGADPINLPRCPNCGSQHAFERVEVAQA